MKKEVNATLTKGEIKVLKCLHKGMTAKQAGKVLKVSSRTVEFHVHNMFTKLKVNSTLRLVLKTQPLMKELEDNGTKND